MSKLCIPHDDAQSVIRSVTDKTFLYNLSKYIRLSGFDEGTAHDKSDSKRPTHL